MISVIESGRREPTQRVREALDRALAIRPSLALRRRRDEVTDVVRRHGGLSAAVIGSTARGDDRPSSDLDLLVEFEEGRDIVDLLSMEEELSELLTVPVDVVSAGSTGTVLEQSRRDAVPL